MQASVARTTKTEKIVYMSARQEVPENVYTSDRTKDCTSWIEDKVDMLADRLAVLENTEKKDFRIHIKMIENASGIINLGTVLQTVLTNSTATQLARPVQKDVFSK